MQRWMIRKHKALWCGGHGAFIVQLTCTVRDLSERSKSEVFNESWVQAFVVTRVELYLSKLRVHVKSCPPGRWRFLVKGMLSQNRADGGEGTGKEGSH